MTGLRMYIASFFTVAIFLRHLSTPSMAANFVFGAVVGSDCTNSGLVVEEQDRFTLYKVTFCNVPRHLCAQDFKVELIGTQFAHVTSGVADIEWKVQLHQSIPPDKIFYPEFGVLHASNNINGSIWEITFRIPKYYSLTPVLFTPDTT